MKTRTREQEAENHFSDMDRLKKERRIQEDLQLALNREEKMKNSVNIEGLDRVIELIGKFKNLK